jgi:hypothetical protein
VPGQGIGALVLDRVLRGKDEKRLGQGNAGFAYRDLGSSMASRRADWTLAGARFTSSARRMLVKTGPRWE